VGRIDLRVIVLTILHCMSQRAAWIAFVLAACIVIAVVVRF
jgi:hypothetical protein